MQFLYMTYMTYTAILAQDFLSQLRGHEIYNFRRLFLERYYYIYGLSDLCLGVEKKIFKEIIQLHSMTHMASHALS